MRKGIQQEISKENLDDSAFVFEGKIYEIIGNHEDESIITTVTPFWDVYLPLLRNEDGEHFKGYIYSYSKFESGKQIFILEAMKQV